MQVCFEGSCKTIHFLTIYKQLLACRSFKKHRAAFNVESGKNPKPDFQRRRQPVVPNQNLGPITPPLFLRRIARPVCCADRRHTMPAISAVAHWGFAVGSLGLKLFRGGRALFLMKINEHRFGRLWKVPLDNDFVRARCFRGISVGAKFIFASKFPLKPSRHRANSFAWPAFTINLPMPPRRASRSRWR